MQKFQMVHGGDRLRHPTSLPSSSKERGVGGGKPDAVLPIPPY